MNQPAVNDDLRTANDELPPSLQWSPKSPTVADRRPVQWREPATVLVWIAASDWLLFRGDGYAGWAAFLLATPMLLAFGAWRPRWSATTLVLLASLLIIAARVLWHGSPMMIVTAAVLTLACALSVAGGSPFVMETAAFAWKVIAGGCRRVLQYRWPGQRSGTDPAVETARTSPARFATILPLVVGLLFVMIFVLANPDLLTVVNDGLRRGATILGEWILAASPWELAFWITSGWIGLGLIRPALPLPQWDPPAEPTVATPVDSPWYPALRNTLITVVALFGVYLVFEFRTLWFREFPEGFYYAGYAHQGAAWLTIALALATVILSLAFRGNVLRERRIVILRRLAWVWSAQNFLLAISVYNRLLIYIGFNGMTRMRAIGLLGITAVVIGFLLVVYKIIQHKPFLWLIRYQLLTVALLGILYSVAPVDWLAHRYNVWAVHRGNQRPAVQIAVKPIDNEGIFALLNLVDAEDAAIRGGIRAILAKRERVLRSAVAEQQRDWTKYQGADHLLRRRLNELPPAKRLSNASLEDIDQEIEAFRRYTAPWY